MVPNGRMSATSLSAPTVSSSGERGVGCAASEGESGETLGQKGKSNKQQGGGCVLQVAKGTQTVRQTESEADGVKQVTSRLAHVVLARV